MIFDESRFVWNVWTKNFTRFLFIIRVIAWIFHEFLCQIMPAICLRQNFHLMHLMGTFSNPLPREVSLTWTLPKCIRFLRMGGKVQTVIFKVFGVIDYESEVRISKFKMADPIWWTRLQYFNKFWIFCCIWLKNSYAGVSGVGHDDSAGRL